MGHVGVWAALAAVFLLGCKPRPTSHKEAPPSPDLDRGESEPERLRDPAEVARAGQRLTALLSQHPEPFLSLRPLGATPAPGTLPALRAQVGKPLSFQSAIPGIRQWSDAHIGRFAVRLPGGVQESVEPRADGALRYTFLSGGPAMLMMCAGPKSEAPSGSWFEVSHCTKVIVRIADARGRFDPTKGITVTGETGLPIDVVPLASPLEMTTGSILPVSFVVMNEEEAGVEVAALRPDGTIDRQITDGAGVARFLLSQPGRWIVRIVELRAEGERVGELVFDVPEVQP